MHLVCVCVCVCVCVSVCGFAFTGHICGRVLVRTRTDHDSQVRIKFANFAWSGSNLGWIWKRLWHCLWYCVGSHAIVSHRSHSPPVFRRILFFTSGLHVPFIKFVDIGGQIVHAVYVYGCLYVDRVLVRACACLCVNRVLFAPVVLSRHCAGVGTFSDSALSGVGANVASFY
jgi:hypothetical protein